MRKRLLLMMFALPVMHQAKAQYLLSGNSYEQHFDTLASGLPDGWEVDTNATATSPGGSAAAGFINTPAAATRWGNAGGAFKNVASANGFPSFVSATSSLQLAAKDRALGVKQTGSFGDPGAAFVFKINNTFRLSDFKLDFKIQSLDSSAGSRVTSWKLQYGTGEMPHFTTVASGMATGGNTYSNILVSNHFGAALDDQRFPVWIRIITAAVSSGGGARTTTAIDDVRLSWTGWADTAPRPVITGYVPANAAIDVPLGSLLRIRFNRHISIGSGTGVSVKDETANTLQVLDTTDALVNGKELSFTGLKLQPGHTYHVTFDSSIADTAGLAAYGVTDTTAWRFKVTNSIPVSALEYFDSACSKYGSLAAGWYSVSTAGAAAWHCEEHAAGNNAMRIYGYDGTAFTVNEDWLITPMLDLRSTAVTGLAYRLFKKGSGPELQLVFSTDYAGSGSPVAATWLPAPLTKPSAAADTGKWVVETVAAATLKMNPFYLAFKYTATAAGGYDILVDSFSTMSATTGIADIPRTEGSVTIAGYPERDRLQLAITAPAAAAYTFRLFNMLGQPVHTRLLSVAAGTQQLAIDGLDLAPGLYIIRLSGDGQEWLAKCLIR